MATAKAAKAAESATSWKMWWMQWRYSGRAVSAAATQGVTLNYSVESFDKLEQLLGKLHDRYAASGDETGLVDTALQYAAYVVTVLEKNYGKGVWSDEDPHHAESSYGFHLQGITIFPVGLCLKRIIDGPKEDIAARLRACTRHLHRAQP
ncbi:hypothetical protein DB346_14630 [Verrucomicrobia bacterium LW23]|nr:hypothetical protein DB346_14630 [Verrucomicrobia bacterium LW23]